VGLRLWTRRQFQLAIDHWWLMGAGGLIVAAIGPTSVWRTLTGRGPRGNIAAALMNASFGLLTIVGTEVLDSKNATVHALATMITIAGQLCIAPLIGMVLGRSHKRLI
jgi:hypothetical protein